MTYEKPDLFLVGAAKGLVLGANEDIDPFPDNPGEGGNTASEPDVSRASPR